MAILPIVIGAATLVGLAVASQEKDDPYGTPGMMQGQMGSSGTFPPPHDAGADTKEVFQKVPQASPVVPLETIKDATFLPSASVDWSKPVHFSINGSTLAQDIKNGSPRARDIFRMPYSTAQLTRDPQLGLDRGPFVKPKTIIIDSWESYRFFGNLFGLALLMLDSKNQRKIREAEMLLNFFDYHAFVLHKAFRQQVATVLVQTSCKESGMLPEYSHNNAMDSWARPNDRYPAPTSPYAGDWIGECKDFIAVDQQKRINLLAEQVSRNIVYEYGVAKYMQVAFLASVDPALAAVAAGEMEKSGKAAIGLVGGILTTALASFMGASATVPVAGWIVAAITAVAYFISGLVQMFGAIDHTRAVRQAVHDKVSAYLSNYMTTPFNITNFSGYKWQVVIPADPYHDDIRDPLFGYFGLAWTRLVYPPSPMGWAVDGRAFPEAGMQGVSYATAQLPFFYLGIDFPLPVSLAQPSGNFLVLLPITDGNGPTVGVQVIEMTKSQFAQALHKK